MANKTTELEQLLFRAYLRLEERAPGLLDRGLDEWMAAFCEKHPEWKEDADNYRATRKLFRET
jgi:hypothetical protein